MSFITQTAMALEAWLSGNRVLGPGFESRQGVRFYIAYDTKMATYAPNGNKIPTWK
jgi:hypothetical protein